MTSQFTNMKCLGVLILVTWVRGHYLKDPTRYNMHFKEIPKRFELRGNTASKDFQTYFEEIQNIAKKENITIIYKINLDIWKPNQYKKSMGKRVKTKKYNIPLKKNSMKLSNFEVMVRKMAEQTGHGSNQNFENVNIGATTEMDRKILSTKIIQLKYKPVISKVRVNYTKIVRPVRNRIITLTV